MHWNHIEAGNIGDLPLDLYERSGEYMIRVDGLELMNSHWHRSETALADIATEVLDERHRPRVMLGGLGLGYTLAAFLNRFGDEADLCVVEKSIDVLTWYKKYFKPKVVGMLDDTKVCFIPGDVYDIFSDARHRFDLIVLDVDNGPEAIAGETNRELYNLEGLRQIAKSIAPGGALLLWSGFRSELFESTARAAGFSVGLREIDLNRHELQHFIYILRPLS